ncbi:MAG: di-heme-cytochrome C peroxidase [Xanthobacteraceae bacterium]
MTAFDNVMRLAAAALASAILASTVSPGRTQPTNPAPPPVTYAEQGWSAADRDSFYTTSQGSRLMPYAWFKALRRQDGQPFAGDQLQRFGYLPNARSRSNPEGLPIGFIVDGSATSGILGMTCAACHTAQLEYQKDGETRALRLDGAPAHADFQLFLTELTAASRATLAEADRFAAFAKAVLGTGYSTAKAAQLKVDFGAWVKQFGDFMEASLPTAPWGPGRLDAFGMIFNRVAARDLGIAANFKIADAPVSYPFLWNASRQDRTQWNGGVRNGLFIQALGRNTGEVYGVFADFKPKIVAHVPSRPPLISYSDNSAKFSGLQTLEEKIAALKPPPWPRDIFPIDDQRAERGKTLFATHCAECHAETASTDVLGAWVTPVKAVGTDPKMVENAERMSDSGVLAGAPMPPPPIGATLANPAKTGDVLANVVVGSLIDEAFDFPLTPRKIAQSGVWRAIRKDLKNLFPDENLDDISNAQPSARSVVRLQAFVNARLKSKMMERLNDMFRKPATADAGAAYESRVLYGIWATAPYLHNGSVPNLWELLKPASQRKSSFSVGSRTFDPKNVGYATDQTPFANGTFTADPAIGNGNGGHEYGTGLSEDERWELVEYLKQL